MVRFGPTIFSTPLSHSNLCSVYLSSGIPHSILDSFSIHSSVLQFESFLVMGFINELVRNLSILRLVVFDSIKQWANT